MKKKEITGLIDSGSKVNSINLAYTAKLDLQMQKTGVDAQKINIFFLNTYDMVITTL